MKPGVPFGTMIVLSSFDPSAFVPVMHATMTKDVIDVPEFVINVLAPFITHSLFSSFAVVRIRLASLPPSGSVSPNPASACPLIRGPYIAPTWLPPYLISQMHTLRSHPPV